MRPYLHDVVRGRCFEENTGQPCAVAGLPGQRRCVARGCTDVDALAAFASAIYEAAAEQPNQTVSITFVARRSSIAA